MNTLTIEGWCKASGAKKSTPMGQFHFRVNEPDHVRLEQAEERLQQTHEPEAMLDVDMSTMELVTPEECGPLSDCKLRVYLSAGDERGQFHLVGHRASDGSLVYTNAVMIDQLG
ncbi:hypothetical protein ACSX1C_08965 [Pseudomonas sp. MBLB4123]|uniref:Uncharacterized protein n=1 Tax=Pseudomonas benzenivorans TaxID=556533 RepID=A0ABZ0PZV0_9PSED|nr:hypothetical protein [Pseudomonas benzenivorans]WPC06471.1 hypothetical protein SBP02_06865 [Pseudomonas benzenivorans]